jgi:hypothetical protein
MKRVRISIEYRGVASVDTEVEDDFELSADTIDFDRWPELDRPVDLDTFDWSMEEL